MNYLDIKTFDQRCQDHPDHLQGMISARMITQRLNEEIDELRAYIESVVRVRQTPEGVFWEQN